MASFTNRFFTLRAAAQKIALQLSTELASEPTGEAQESQNLKRVVARPHLTYALDRARAAQVLAPVNNIESAIASRDAYERFLETCQATGHESRHADHLLTQAELALMHASHALVMARQAQALVV
jgi:hypothetical protein